MGRTVEEHSACGHQDHQRCVEGQMIMVIYRVSCLLPRHSCPFVSWSSWSLCLSRQANCGWTWYVVMYVLCLYVMAQQVCDKSRWNNDNENEIQSPVANISWVFGPEMQSVQIPGLRDAGRIKVLMSDGRCKALKV